MVDPLVERLRKKTFIPLHLHTAKGSIGDSIVKIKDLVKKAKSMGLNYLAVTNHGSMADMYDFYEQCSKEEITPIIGCEVYEAADRTKGEDIKDHLVLLAKNDVGLKNLLYIVTDANLNGFYYKPRTDHSVLQEHGEGIIALSACLGGKIPQVLLPIIKGELSQEEAEAKFFAAVELVKSYKEYFDEFYLEIQPGNFDEQIQMNQMLVHLAEFTETPLVVTNDIHYLDPDDWHAHDVHVKINRKQKLDDPQIYPDKCYYLQSYYTIIKSFPYLDQSIVEKAIKNTELIAQKCYVDLKSSKLNMPIFSVPEGHTETTYLAKITWQQLEEIKASIQDPAEYATRLEYELDVIDELGFSGYFLTVRDFVMYAKHNDIPVGPGRGSVCGLI
jgi:DNA polymerase-3 subunit alpha